MMFYLVPEGCHIDVGVYLCCADTFVAQHGLYGTQGTAAF